MTLLCEDTQHDVFARRFLEKSGWNMRQIKPIKAPGGRGAADQFIRSQFPRELQALRRQHGTVSLVVIVDGDRFGPSERLTQLDEACDKAGVQRKQPDESVFVFVPTWNIETWLAYLDDQQVIEDKRDYPRLTRQRDCRRHVGQLAEMCQANQLKMPAPPSLSTACEEFVRLVDQFEKK